MKDNINNIKEEGIHLDNRPIGVMDSGVGGLTVLKQIVKLLPNESYIFIGDQANLPYGQKSSETVRKLTKRIADYMITQDIKMFVMACNTATAAAFDYLSEILSVPVIGVIEPGCRSAVQATHNGQIGVIATNGTVKSGDYERIIKKLAPNSHVYSLGCPEFVTMVEQGLAGTPETQLVVNQRLAYFADKPIDTLVMGCTHFPVLRKEITNVLGTKMSLVDPGIAAGQDVYDYLKQHGALCDPASSDASRRFFTTGDPDEFAKLADNILGNAIAADHLDI